MIEDMVDMICEDKLIAGLENCSKLIQKIHLLPEEKQIDIFY